MRALIVLLALLSLAASPLRAAESAGPLAVPATRDYEMPVLIAPIVVEERLKTFVYLRVILTAVSLERVAEIEARAPYLQDAFVREVYRAPIGTEQAAARVDFAGLGERLRARADEQLGPGLVESVKVTDGTELTTEPLPPPAAIELPAAH